VQELPTSVSFEVVVVAAAAITADLLGYQFYASISCSMCDNACIYLGIYLGASYVVTRQLTVTRGSVCSFRVPSL
jgi:hypothetical protein